MTYMCSSNMYHFPFPCSYYVLRSVQSKCFQPSASLLSPSSAQKITAPNIVRDYLQLATLSVSVSLSVSLWLSPFCSVYVSRSCHTNCHPHVLFVLTPDTLQPGGVWRACQCQRHPGPAWWNRATASMIDQASDDERLALSLPSPTGVKSITSPQNPPWSIPQTQSQQDKNSAFIRSIGSFRQNLCSI